MELHESVAEKSSPYDEETLATLMQEYDSLSKNVDSAMAQLSSLVTVLITAIATIFSSTSLIRFDLTGLMLVPITVMIVSGIILHLFVRWSAFAMQARLVSARISQITHLPRTDLFYHRDSPASRFQSLRKSSAYKSFVLILFSMVIVMVVFLNINFTLRIYQTHHLYGLLYGIFISAIMLFFLFAIYSAMTDLPRMYDQAIAQSKAQADSPVSFRISKPAADFLLLPRPGDFVTKTWLFAAGVAAGLWIGGWVYNNRIADLFVVNDYNAARSKWMIFAFAVCWFLVQELIIQQAKYAWNDLRDLNQDANVPGKKERAITHGAHNPALVAGMVIVRFALGLLLGYLLDARLFAILLIILIVQIFYELWVKPNAARAPAVASVVIALGSAIRFISGALAVSDHVALPITLLTGFFFFFGLGYIAKYWLIEAEYNQKNGLKYPPRPQSDFFVRHGLRWQHYGFIGMLLFAVLFWVERYLYIERGLDGLAWLKTAAPGLGREPLSFLLSLLASLLLVGALSALLYKPLSGALLALNRIKILPLLMAAVVVAGLALARINPQITPVYALVGLALMLIAVLILVSYENMTYEQYLMVHMRANARYIAQLWFVYLFSASSKLTFKSLVLLSGLLMNESFDEVLKKLQAKGVDVSAFTSRREPSQP